MLRGQYVALLLFGCLRMGRAFLVTCPSRPCPPLHSAPDSFEESDWSTEAGGWKSMDDDDERPIAASSDVDLSELLEGPETKFIQEQEKRKAQVDRMTEAGVSPEQMQVYLGESDEPSAPDAVTEMMEAFQAVATEEELAYERRRSLFGKVPSHELVELDEGKPTMEQFVYVDEYTCIGTAPPHPCLPSVPCNHFHASCTHCSHVADNTFFMDDEFGRARVFQQGGDNAAVVREAIETCPVDCIHYVGWDELTKLEKEREGVVINFKARLVGNDHDAARAGQQTISGNQGSRCGNCPSRGCYRCPMYGVGFNPEFLAKKEKLEARKKEKLRLEKLAQDDSSITEL